MNFLRTAAFVCVNLNAMHFMMEIVKSNKSSIKINKVPNTEISFDRY